MPAERAGAAPVCAGVRRRLRWAVSWLCGVLRWRVGEGCGPGPGSIGGFYWGGSLGPFFWADPAQVLLAILMLQEANMAKRTHYRSLLRNLVCQALAD